MNAIITGATKGIGRAIALKLAQSGYHLAICSRSAEDLNAFKLQLETYQITVLSISTDLAHKDEVMAFCHQAANTFTQIDVLVNNAGVFMPGNLLEEDDYFFENQIAVNLNSVYYLSKFFGKIMRTQRCGHIFNICSVASRQVMTNAGSYSVTKAAMLSLNNVLRGELAEHNVKVTAVMPGSTLTASWEGTTISSERFVQPEDIANAINTALNLSTGVNVDEITLTPLKF